ncbi:Flagellar biosynthesis protein FlhA [hydrothermal vent metagenome]|uniref:Flagellar biosynthesis protein FlhA n=1 Tax=hydrothermal vent metagenome TaxID=652676 RepID=A0A3B1E903_9ZZZZ
MNQPGTQGDGLPAWMRSIYKHKGMIVPLGFVGLLVVILVPLPPFAMDLLIAGNISLAVIILLTTVYMAKPLDFSVFPSLLLATTMLRLVINIASTRLILTADATSPEEAVGVAGKVISAFGEFVAGDSLFVGVVIFLILVIVQFIVITKGAGRVSEVAARFTLDAMPGKQMAIDSDLNAGLINEAEARQRREEISSEADFFGAMDGASKFVRGDAIAGIIITGINIVGGLAVGIIDHGWPVGQTAQVFTKLTIGDGLTSQIPSFVISISAALIVTRSGARADLGEELTDQLMSQPRGLVITAVFLSLLALTPLPTVPLLATGGTLGLIAFGMFRSARVKVTEARESAVAEAQIPAEPPPIETLLKVDTMELEIGYGLVSLVDAGQGGDLLGRISAIRRQLAAEIGLVTPPIRIRDNMQLEPGQYRVKIRGAAVASGELRPGMLMAMDSGIATGKVQGERTTEPAFGLDAWWINPDQRHRAETMNYTVVDPTSVLATHLTEIVKQHAAELLTREEVNNLVENLRAKSPKLVEEAIPALVKVSDLQRVLHNLLRERVPIRDMETIVETLADWAPKSSDVDILTEYVRNALRRVICEQHTTPGDNGKPRIVCVTLDPSFEDQIAAYIERGPAGTSLSMPARVATQTAEMILRSLQRVTASGNPPVVIASPQVRAVVWQILEPHLPTAVVLGYNEIPPGIEVESMGLVSPESEAAATVSAA